MDLERRGKKPATIRVFTGHVRRLFEACGWTSPAQINFREASAYLARMRKERHWTGTTTDGIVSAYRSFTKYLLTAEILHHDPFVGLQRSGEMGGAGVRALTVDEARRLILVGYAASMRDGRSKVPRGLWYGFLCLTGLRSNEARLCTWGDVDLDSAVPAIYTDPKWSKNKKRQRVVLASELVEKLREWRKCVANDRTDRVFPQTSHKWIFARDREAAGIPEIDARGRRVGAHSARKATATWLYDAGVSDAVIARILRHETTLTQARYIDPDPTMEVEAIALLPKVFPSQSVSIGETTTKKNFTVRIGKAVENRRVLDDTHPSETSSPDNKEHRPPSQPEVSQTRASQDAPGAGSFVRGGSEPDEGSAAGRESPVGGSRDQGPDFQPKPVMGIAAENEAVLIFARAVELLGRLLTEHADGQHAGPREDPG